MRYVTLVLLLVLAGCCAVVEGERGTVTAVNFLPEKSPQPWQVYVDEDGGNSSIWAFGDRPNVKVGDHVVARYYSEGGQFQGLFRDRPRARRLE